MDWTDCVTMEANPPGSSPGLLRDSPGGRARVTLTVYGPDGVETIADATPERCAAARSGDRVVWLDVAGTPDGTLLRTLGDSFGLHTLALEDVQDSGAQRPKVETYDAHLFVITNAIDAHDDALAVRNVGLFLGRGFVVSFHDRSGDPFRPIRRRLEAPTSRMRGRGADYLLYALVDLSVDEKFPLLEALGERIEALETALLDHPEEAMARTIHAVKRDLLLLRRCAFPERDVVGHLLRDDTGLISPDTRIFLRDCHDHAVQTIEVLESHRDMAASLMDVYIGGISNRLNQVMKVLTGVATVFMPLSFLAGVYGMNFDRASPWGMPELGWAYGYPAIWAVFLAVAGTMLWWFRRRGFFR